MSSSKTLDLVLTLVLIYSWILFMEIVSANYFIHCRLNISSQKSEILNKLFSYQILDWNSKFYIILDFFFE